MIPLPKQHYNCIAADPPWSFAVRSDKGKGRSAEKHYGCLSLPEIKALPVAELAAQDCVLLLWVTDPLLPAGLEVIRAWGFQYKTVGFYWAKTNADGSPFCGLGYWTRANPEQCLLATRGQPKRTSKSVRRLIVAPHREHSRKPDQFFENVTTLLPGPYLDLFSRERRPAWDSWGDETGKFNTLTGRTRCMHASPSG